MINKAVTKIGWIGTGQMGKSMASNLMKGGYQLSVFNRTRWKADELIEKGATFVECPRELASQCDYLFLVLGKPQNVEDIIYGE